MVLPTAPEKSVIGGRENQKIIVTHLEKPGVSEARNWGLQHASDDCVTENYLKALHDAIENTRQM